MSLVRFAFGPLGPMCLPGVPGYPGAPSVTAALGKARAQATFPGSNGGRTADLATTVVP